MFNHAFIKYSLVKILYFTIIKKEIKEIFKIIKIILNELFNSNLIVA